MRQARQSIKFQKFKNRRNVLNSGSMPSHCVFTMNNNTSRYNGVIIEFPLIQNDQVIYSPKKMIEDQNYRKPTNFRAMKILARPNEEQRRKNDFNSMNMLGLDIKKVNWQINNKRQQSSQICSHGRLSVNSSINKPRNSSPRCLQSLHSKTFFLRNNTEQTLGEQQNQKISPQYMSSNSIMKLQMVQSDNLQKKQNKPSSISPKKHQKYLYQKLASKPILLKKQINNFVYERRIKSYVDLLWKVNFAHNIYYDLTLKSQDFFKVKKMKAFVGYGNNSSMIKGLLKRRFWWVICQDQNDEELNFVWTQTKNNNIFVTQKKSIRQKPIYKQQQEQDQQKGKQFCKSAIKFKRSSSIQYRKQIQNLELYNYKVLAEQDVKIYRKYFDQYQKSTGKQRPFQFRRDKLNKQLREAQQNHTPLVHNHLQNNFYLGNKKALFYNLKQYCELVGQNLHEYIPLTFHIKKGIKDIQYKRFLSYYQRRKKQIKRQQQQQQQGYTKKKTRNIWIVKPGQNSNRGRGITVIDQIYELNAILKEGQINSKAKIGQQRDPKEENQNTFIVQMYIDRPLLYNGRKFDIRHFMLMTNLHGITRAYWYEEGYIRTSSYDFNIHQFQPEIHLTNDAIQKQYAQYGKYQPANKISYAQFQRYLDASYKQKKIDFKKSILSQMKRMATDAARSVYTKISPRNQMHNFQIFGFDFMIDKNFKPWLIQINTNPCLEVNCPLLDRIIPYMVEQSLKLTLDCIYPPPCHYPNSMKHLAPLVDLDIFKFQLIFDSQVQGDAISAIYKKAKSNLIDQIGEISQDQTFKDDGKQIKLDQFS